MSRIFSKTGFYITNVDKRLDGPAGPWGDYLFGITIAALDAGNTAANWSSHLEYPVLLSLSA